MSYRKIISHNEYVIRIAGLSLNNSNSKIRKIALEIIALMLDKADEKEKKRLSDKYFQIILEKVQHDPSLEVRQRS